jgi:high-affinity iron transporter
MLASALITLREGLEAALIVGIVLSYLAKIGRLERQSSVWAGVGVATLLSLGAALVLQAVGGEFSGAGEQIFEGAAMFLAAGILTWMIFWMQRQSRHIKGELEAGIRQTLDSGSRWGLFGLAFVAVLREGLETALFLTAAVFAASPAETIAGGLLGLAVAVVLGGLVFAGSRRLNVSSFFRITGVALVVFAAGLVASGVHEFEEASLLPPLVEHIWSTRSMLDDTVGLGAMLRSLVGYFAEPSLMQVMAYTGYYALAALGMRIVERASARAPQRVTSVSHP